MVLLLASASPRRRELLERIGVPLRVAPVDVDESVREGEGPEAYLERVVEAKRAAAAARGLEGSRGLLVADTSVICDERILGKPADESASARMIRHLAGRWHRVATRFVLEAGDRQLAQTVATRVRFRDLADDEIAAYAATGEGFDKAGAYGIQGIGAMLVTRIDGSYTNVVGLPLAEVVAALREFDLWRPLRRSAEGS